MNCKGAIFDMDGLLFDTERLYQQTWEELAQEQGVVLSPEFTSEISGTSGPEMEAVIRRHYKTNIPSTIVDSCMQRMESKLTQSVPVKRSVPEILDFFQDHNIPMAVASSSPRNRIITLLERSGLMCYFRAIVSGEDVVHGKPEPDIFQLAAQKLGCSEKTCMVFEDSENGIRAGYTAGCIPVMIPDLVEPGEDILGICAKVYTNFQEAVQDFQNNIYLFFT